MKQITIPTTSEEELRKILQGVVKDALTSYFPTLNKPNAGYLTRAEVSKLLKISLPTVSDYTKRGILQGYRIGRRVLFKTDEIESSVEKIKHLKYKVDIGPDFITPEQ
jgi:excisionase family DNA binding protein